MVDTRTVACKRCGESFEAHVVTLMGKEITLGGYCTECAKLVEQEREAKESARIQKELTDKREDFRRKCGIPLRFQASRFEVFDQKVNKSIVKVYHELVQYAREFSLTDTHSNKSYVMYSSGKWGLGKTFLAAAVAHAIIDKVSNETHACPIYFVSEPSLFLRLRACYNQHGNYDGQRHETEESVFKQLTNVPLLILDDIGKEEVSDARFVQRVLFAVIDGRYQNMLPIMMTANLDTDALDRHLGADRGNSASMDRLVEMTGSAFHELTGETYRDVSNRVSR